MTPPRTHQEFQELLGAYVLDALDADELSAVTGHLAGCPLCRDELRELREIAGALGAADAEPPPKVWEGIASELADTASVPLRRPPAPRVALTRRWTVVAAAAVLVLLAGLASLGVVAVRQQHQLDRANHALASGASEQSIQAAALEAAARPGSRRVALVSPAGTTIATVIIAPGSTAFLVPASMRSLNPGRTYQLWGKHGSELISLAVLGSSPGVTAITVPSGVQALAISTETEPGATAPSAAPVAEVTIA